MKANSFSIGKFTYTIYYKRGIVVGKDKNFETQVHGSGGGGGTYQGTGSSVSISVSSTTYIHDKIFLQHEDGKESVLELTDWDIACREGHELLIVWIIRDDKNNGHYLAIKNMTTDTTKYKYHLIDNLIEKKPNLFISFFDNVFFWISLLAYFLSSVYLAPKKFKDYDGRTLEFQEHGTLGDIFTNVFVWLLIAIGFGIYRYIRKNNKYINDTNKIKKELNAFLSKF